MHIAQVMIDILKSSESLCKGFFEQMIEGDHSDVLLEVLLEANNSDAR